MVPAFNCSRRSASSLTRRELGARSIAPNQMAAKVRMALSSSADGDDVLEPNPERQNNILGHMSNLTIFHMMAMPMP